MSDMGRAAFEQDKPEGLTVVEISEPVGSTTRSPFVQSPERRAHTTSRSALARVPRAAICATVTAILWLFAAAGFVTLSIGGSRTNKVFNDMSRAAQLSSSAQHLIRAYQGCYWAAFATAIAALITFPAAVISACVAIRAFTATSDHSHKLDAVKRRTAVTRGVLITVTLLCSFAAIAAVIFIAANVKAADKVAEVQSKVDSGSSLISEVSSTLTAVREARNSTSVVDGLFSSVLGALSGSSGSAESTGGLTDLASGLSLQSIATLIAPMTVGNLVQALDVSPQGLLNLAALISSKFGYASSPGLTCTPQCLNQGDACICNVNQLSVLDVVQSTAQRHIRVAQIGSCMLAFGMALLALVTLYTAANLKFQQQLVLSDRFDRHVACKHALLARSNADIVGISHDTYGKQQNSPVVPIQAQAAEN